MSTIMTPAYDAVRILFTDLAVGGALPNSFQYAFVINAFLCALVIGPLLGVTGTLIVAKRMAFFSQAVGNAALTGVAIGILLGEPYTAPYVSMFSFCVLFAIVMKYTQNRTNLSTDTVIGVFLSISLALGASLLLFVSARVNTHIMETLLFGSILTVSDVDMNVLLLVTLVSAAFAAWFYNATLLASLNPSLAHARGLAVRRLDYAFVILIAVITVASIKIVGAALVEALLLIPAAASRNVARSLKGFVIWSAVFATVSCIVGIIAPMELNLPLPSGGAIVLTAAALFAATAVARATVARFREAGV